MTKQVAVLIGSNSKTSANQAAVRYLQKIAPNSLELKVVEIADLPLYDRDLDDKDVPEYTRVRDAIKACDAVIWVTPEHNGGVSAMLKNAIDVVSRPAGQSQWVGKPLGLVTVNASGSNRTTDDLRVIASGASLSMPVAPFSAAVGGIFAGAIEDGELVSQAGQKTLQGFIEAYAKFIERF